MNRSKLAGLVFVACLQFFVAEGICAALFTSDYSYLHNYISDLGAVDCTAAHLCSPSHAIMNASFVLQGFLIVSGSLICWPLWSSDHWAKYALLLLVIAGLSLALVGVNPEDAAPSLHYKAAGVHLTACNLSLLFFAAARQRPPLPRTLFLLAGSLGLIGVISSAIHFDLGLGAGGMERIAAYPFVLMLVASGAALLISASGQGGRP